MKNENRHGGSPSYRYYVRLNEKDNSRFLDLYEKSGIGNKSEFIRRRLFLTPFRVITHDKSAPARGPNEEDGFPGWRQRRQGRISSIEQE